MASISEMIQLAKYQSGEGRFTGQGGGGGIVDAIAGAMEEKRKRKEEKVKNQFDMYKTLRDSGYDPQSAHKAVLSNQFPAEVGGLKADEQKKSAEIKSIDATTKVREAQAAKLTAETGELSKNKKNLTMNILNKIAEGVDLTPGEQKVYDEVIRKYGNKSALEEALGGMEGAPAAAAKAVKAAAPVVADEYVPMLDPKGVKKKVHKYDVQKALKQGWKTR